MRATTYHVLLRISSLTIALVLLFDSGLLLPVTKELSLNTQYYLAQSIGVGASVAPTELNELTAQISQRNRDLDVREAALSEREITVELNTQPATADSNVSTYILSLILFVIMVLMVLNYALDFAREKRLIYRKENEQTA